MIDANGVELCTEPFGASTAPPILLIAGIGSSMLWWEEPFCRTLADAGRFVIRYDHRDTGRSITYEPGRPGTPGPIWSPTRPECSMPTAWRRHTW